MVNDLADTIERQIAPIRPLGKSERPAVSLSGEQWDAVLSALRRPVPADVAGVVERLSKRADKIRGYIASSQIVVDLLKPEMDKFEARTGHDLYTVRMAVDHESGIRTQTKELDELTEAAALLTTLASGRGECSIVGIWEQARVNHETYSATGDPESDLRFLTLGLCGEAGELANFVKKRWRDGDLHEDDCRKEVADVLAYTMMVAQCLGMRPADLIATVAEKQEIFVAKMAAKRPNPPQGDQQ